MSRRRSFWTGFAEGMDPTLWWTRFRLWRALRRINREMDRLDARDDT